jgi:glutamine synthetase
MAINRSTIVLTSLDCPVKVIAEGIAMNEIKIKNFKEIPYDELEELNLAAKEKTLNRVPEDTLREYYLRYLADEKQLKAVTVCFSDLEGRFHMLDYDKKFLIRAKDNLTFDGSSIRGFTPQQESDLRLGIDWSTFRWLPSDVFGPGKVMAFGLIMDKDGSPYDGDMRSRLKRYNDGLWREQQLTTNVAVEIEGFLFQGINAEQNYNTRDGFKFVSEGGYFHCLPTAPLKIFIDRFAEAQRALAFENEKDHPEVAPSQFELNYSYGDALVAADQIQLYKLLARQIAANMNFTASFLPKPLTNINGSGMHTNVSLSRAGQNIFYDAAGEERLSPFAWTMVDRLLYNAEDLCLILNSSVNSYRRLDPHYEAPNQIRASAVDRAAMIRIPLGDAKSARIEVRSVAPDANPYLAILALLQTGLEGPYDPSRAAAVRQSRAHFLPDCLQRAIQLFVESRFVSTFMGEENHRKFAEIKAATAARSPQQLGSRIKLDEIIYHHEITNQHLWAQF